MHPSRYHRSIFEDLDDDSDSDEDSDDSSDEGADLEDVDESSGWDSEMQDVPPVDEAERAEGTGGVAWLTLSRRREHSLKRPITFGLKMTSSSNTILRQKKRYTAQFRQT